MMRFISHSSRFTVQYTGRYCMLPAFRNLCTKTDATTALDNSLIITKSCAKRINELTKKMNKTNAALRVGVDAGGCSGFQYTFNMDDSEPQIEDKVFERDGAKVVVDDVSFDLIKGSTVDFAQEVIRSAFVVVNNPQSESACGCKSSFALKAFAANPAID